MRTIGQCRLAKAFDTPPSVFPRPSDLNCHHILSQQLKQGGGVGGGGRELHCNCFSDWYSVPSIHTRSVARYVYAALQQQQQQPKQQLSYHTEAPPLSLLLLLLLLFLLQLDLNHPSVRHCATSCLLLPLLFGRRFSPAFPRLALGTSIILASPRLT